MFPLATLLLAAASPAAADGPPPSKERLVTVEAGPQWLPRFPGSDDMKLGPLIYIGLRRPGDPISFHIPGQSSDIGLIGGGKKFTFGPTFALQGKRRQKDVGAPVGNVAATFEAGAFVQAWPVPQLRLRADVRKGIGGHRGVLGSVGADGVMRDRDRNIFTIGPRLRFANARYLGAYFGVTPSVASASGLSAFRPRAGLYAAGALTSFIHQFSPAWGIQAYAGYDRLVRDASASPIVRHFGSRDQISAGLGLTHTFAIRTP